MDLRVCNFFLRGCGLCDYRGQWVIGLAPYPRLCRPCRAMTYSDRICSPCRAEIYQPLYRYRIFSKTPPSPLNLKRGSTSPPAPSPQERSPTGKPAVLYSQTSARPKGLLVEFNAIELRLFDATELRVFMRRGRG